VSGDAVAFQDTRDSLQYGDEVSLQEEFNTVNDGVGGKLSITKTGVPVFFSASYFRKALRGSVALHPVYRLVFGAGNFNTKAVVFLGRAGLRKYQPAAFADELVQPGQKYVVSLNQDAIGFLPANVDQWLVDQHGSIPDYWKIIAAPKLLAVISSEVLLLNDELSVVFKGDRRVKLMLNLADEQLMSSIYTTVNTVANWIYSEGKDIETRHHVFNNQVCLLSLSEIDHFFDNFNSIVDRVLENSILAYRYYVQSSNKELTKSLTEINKTLFEHVGKIRQNTVDLVNGLWRDFTTAFGLMILNFSLKKPDVSQVYWNLMLVGLIIYLCSSVGFWFYYRLKQSLTDMRTRIYGYLTDDDFNDFALNPLKSAQRKFIKTFWVILVCYLAIIGVVFFALKTDKAGKGSLTNERRTLSNLR